MSGTTLGPGRGLPEPMDLQHVTEVAAAVDTVQEAATVVDLQVRTLPAVRQERASVREGASRLIPRDRPAQVSGPQPDCLRGTQTLTQALLKAARQRTASGTTYVKSDGTVDRQTYGELLEDARRVLGCLRNRGLAPGDPVIVHLSDNRSFITTWWACVLGGMLPTPVATAREYGSDNAAVRRLHSAWRLLGNPLIVTDPHLVFPVAQSFPKPHPAVVVGAPDLYGPALADPYSAAPESPAFNLLTSGSTGTPKCLQHPHRTVIARTYAAIEANAFNSEEVSLNWMPLDHVGGIVMSNVRDVILGCEQVSVPTDTVIRRPLVWLDLIERFKATTTWAPNFAFGMVNDHEDEIASASWDLSSLRNVCNAGEAVVPRTALHFVELLVPHGLPRDAMVPCWGMSETSSGVTYGRMDCDDPDAGFIAIDPASLEEQLIELPRDTPGAMLVTEVGAPIAGVSLRIVDEDGSLCTEGRVGRLHVSGDTIMSGYLNNPEANRAIGEDGWFDTGDLGFLKDGRLFLTGRKKNMVIVNGANFPAHEVEAVTEQVAGVKPACTAVCSVPGQSGGTDAVVVFFVPTHAGASDLGALLKEVRTRLAADLGFRPHWLVPLTEDEFPRSPGGKVQRERLLTALEEGQFVSRLYEETAQTQESGDLLMEPLWVSGGEYTPEIIDKPLILLRAANGAPSPDTHIGVLINGPTFRILGDRHVEADPLSPEQQDRALTYLAEAVGGAPEVVHTVAVGNNRSDDLPLQLAVQLSAIARVLPSTRVTVITDSATTVTPNEDVFPERAALTALVRTAAAEKLLPDVRLIDSPDADNLDPRHLPRTLSDLTALRNGLLYVPRLRTLQGETHYEFPTSLLPRGGTALLIGGLGGLGRLLAEQLLVMSNARILLTGRTEESQLVGSERGSELKRLRDLGDVTYASVDASDSDTLASLVDEAEAKWGRSIDLIVHLAGEAVAPQWNHMSGHDLAHETLPWFRSMLSPKLGGALAIDHLLATRPATAVLVYSSVNAFLGGSNFGAYATANAGLEGWARHWAARGHLVRCVGWSMWSGPGMNDGSPLITAAENRGLRLIKPRDGISMLLRAANAPATVVLAGIDPSSPQIKEHLASDQFSSGNIVVAIVPRVGVDPERAQNDVGKALAARGIFARVVSLPRLPRERRGGIDTASVLTAASLVQAARYSAPEGDEEELIAQITRDFLGVEQVGRDDSLFSLGCDSIRAVQLVEGIGEAFRRRLSIGLLYENPTVRKLAEALK